MTNNDIPAVKIKTNDFFEIALRAQKNGSLKEIIKNCLNKIQTDSDNSENYNNLAIAQHFKGDLKQAVLNYQRAIKLSPLNYNYYNNLGLTLEESGKLDEAVENYTIAISISLNNINPDFYINRTYALMKLNKIELAISNLKFIQKYYPENANILNCFGIAMAKKRKFSEAINYFSKAIELDHINPEFRKNLENTLLIQDNIINNQESLSEKLIPESEYDKNYSYLSEELEKQEGFDDYRNVYLKILELDPNNLDFHKNYAYDLLRQGYFKEGWKEYEWCLIQKAVDLGLNKPVWDGEDLNGRTLYVYSEQGFGDVIQFTRFLALLKQKNGLIIFSCKPELNTILKSIEGYDILTNNEKDKLPEDIITKEKIPFDCHISLLSLPRIFDISEENLPGKIPYIKVEDNINEYWKQKLKINKSPRVGIVWETGFNNPNFKERSINFKYFYKLAEELPGITFISLQKDTLAQKKLERFPPRKNIVNISGEINDFSDTAAIINNIDLVISVDTSVAHIAGALGKTTWVLLSHIPDWRWMLNRADSLWYPTMKLFRQPAPANWNSVFINIEAELKKIISQS